MNEEDGGKKTTENLDLLKASLFMKHNASTLKVTS